MRSKTHALLALLVGALTPCASGCADDETLVSASLREYQISLSQPNALEGWVTFDITNDGTEHHEFVVVRTELAQDALPTHPDGSYFENGPGTIVLDEIEDIPPGGRAEVTLDLEIGSYVILCNIVELEDDGEIESHYANGMHTAFEVLQG